ncbi:hypothetical protein [Absidia glauca]|uniref:Uncharacterized protein n=1 Tax=Absidia glauca TaxID=4829 RepID=A0A168PHS5_ABSGL|nr:hypothetical protein [Absidia glauca]
MLLNTNLKSGLKRGGRRSYTTGHHQEQDPTPPSGSSTPFIVAGLVALGGIIYYSKTAGPKTTLDPSDSKGQKVQKEADRAIAERTDATGTVYPKDAPSSTVINEKVQQTAHPVATKQAAYVDPKKEDGSK